MTPTPAEIAKTLQKHGLMYGELLHLTDGHGTSEIYVRIAAALAAHAAEVESAALMWAVEWTLKRQTRPEHWPLSWEAGFPGLKAQALIDYAALRAGSGG